MHAWTLMAPIVSLSVAFEYVKATVRSAESRAKTKSLVSLGGINNSIENGQDGQNQVLNDNAIIE